MIAHLRGIISKGMPGDVAVDVRGVGYRVTVPLDAWEMLQEGTEQLVWVSTYVREDRLELFGFVDKHTRSLFEGLIARPGIGPKMGLELCAVPRALLLQAINEEDAGLLTTVKGIGKKTAEKLLLELKSMADTHPGIFATSGKKLEGAQYDQDAIAALTQLGYATPDILRILPTLPKELRTTEERVTAALRSL